MRPAWHNIAHDRIRFLVTVLGIAYAVFLMVFQSRALRGFLGAASKVIDSTDAEIWITRRGNVLYFPVIVEWRSVELPRHSSVLWASPQTILKSNCWRTIQ
jgi:hypothetical protein